MDSWIYEARVSQGLEKRVESVELTERKEEEITVRSALWSLVPSGIVAFSIFNYYTQPLVNSDNLFNGNVAAQIAVTTILEMLSSYGGSFFGLNKYLTSRALTQKRLEAEGLDKDGMNRYDRIETNYQATPETVKKIFLDYGLKKKFFREEFASEGISVKYKPREVSAAQSFVNVELSWTDIDIHYKPGYMQKAEEIASSLKRYRLASGGRSG